jgi:RNA-binding protein 8A
MHDSQDQRAPRGRGATHEFDDGRYAGMSDIIVFSTPSYQCCSLDLIGFLALPSPFTVFLIFHFIGTAGEFESLAPSANNKVIGSVEGYVVYVGNVHPEAQEDDINDIFCEFGDIKQIHLNTNKRTGYGCGYAFVQMPDYQCALDAISSLNGAFLFDQELRVDWAFMANK